MGSLREGWDELRGQLTGEDPVRGHGRGLPVGANLIIVPLAMTAAATAVGMLAYAYDRLAQSRDWWYPSRLRFDGQGEVQTLLITSLSVSITVVTLLASLTLVALTTASTTVGPRQMRAFLRDPIIKVTIGLFLGTFVCSLVLLPWINDGDPTFVASAAAGWVFVLLLCSSLSIPVFLHHVGTIIQPNRVLARVARDLDFAVREYGRGRGRFDGARFEHVADDDLARRLPDPTLPRVVVRAPVSGYFQRVYHDELVTAASSAGAVVTFLKRPGSFVLESEPLAEVVGTDAMAERVLACVDIRSNRTLRQDLEFAVDQLVETGIRALSPAVNDTFTGMMAVDWLGDAIRQLAGSDTGTTVHPDAQGVVRVVDEPLRFEATVRGAFDKLRQCSTDNVAVNLRLFETFERLAPFLRTDEQRAAVLAQVGATWEGAARTDPVALDRVALAGAHARALAALAPPPAD